MADDPIAPKLDSFARDTTAQLFIDALRGSIARQRSLAERALEQVGDDDFMTAIAGGGNSLAILVKHVGGNLRSRFTDFLTSDGEKPDRHRDQEFEIGPEDDRARLMQRWEAGWGIYAAAIDALELDQMATTVAIRTEPYSVVEALLRAHDHIGYHVGQIVQLARLCRGTAWRSLSVPRGGSAAFARAVSRGEISQRTVIGSAGSDEAL